MALFSNAVAASYFLPADRSTSAAQLQHARRMKLCKPGTPSPLPW